MPQAEQTSMQSQNIAAEPLRFRCFGDLRHAQDIAFEVRPAELALALVVFQIAGTAVAAKDTGEHFAQRHTANHRQIGDQRCQFRPESSAWIGGSSVT